jgi:hypothetical protein
MWLETRVVGALGTVGFQRMFWLDESRDDDGNESESIPNSGSEQQQDETTTDYL